MYYDMQCGGGTVRKFASKKEALTALLLHTAALLSSAEERALFPYSHVVFTG